MTSSKLLEQAIIDAQALKEAALKSAQAALIEKYAPEIKEAVEKILEQNKDEEEFGADTRSPTDALAGGESDKALTDFAAGGTDFGGSADKPTGAGKIAGTAKELPNAAMGGLNLCPCPDDNQAVTLELDLGQLTADLAAGTEDKNEKEKISSMVPGIEGQPMAAGGNANLQENEEKLLKLEEDIVEINLEEALMLEEEEEEDEEDEEDESEDEESDEEKEEDESEDEELDEVKKDEKKLTPSQQELAAMREPKDKVTFGDVVAARIASGENSEDKKKTNESKTKQLLTASTQLLKEYQNSVKLVEKKDAQISKLLEENKKFSSTIEEMSQAFKKLEEVNVTNARLFYSNQVLKSASLNERQKTKIVEAISKADSVGEAKVVYETLISSVGGTAEKERSPKSLNEVISKKSTFRLPHKQAEQPVDPNKDRWLKLAGIK